MLLCTENWPLSYACLQCTICICAVPRTEVLWFQLDWKCVVYVEDFQSLHVAILASPDWSAEDSQTKAECACSTASQSSLLTLHFCYVTLWFRQDITHAHLPAIEIMSLRHKRGLLNMTYILCGTAGH